MQLKIAPANVPEVVALAYELSRAPMTPVCRLQFRPGPMGDQDKAFYADEAADSSVRYIHCDYIRGRSVKLYLRRHPKHASCFVLPQELEMDHRWLDHYEQDCLRLVSLVRSLPENSK